MKPAGRLHPIALAILLGALLPARAQVAPSAPSPTSPPATAPAPDGGYVDKVIEGLAPEEQAEAQAYPYDQTGWPRFLKLETRLGTEPFDDRRSARLGYSVYGVLETPNHGTLSIDALYAPDDSDGTLTLRQTNMPLGGGWLANHSLGYVDTPSPGITRLPSRVFVPTSILEGVSGEWEHPGKGFQFQAATGEPGRLEILPSTGFRRLPGRRSVLGAQWRLGADAAADPLGLSRKGWTLAAQHENARGVSNFETPVLPQDVVDANASMLALRHEGERHRLKAHAVSSNNSALDGGRSGYWIDGEWDEGPRQYGAGLYRLDQGLNWANLPMANDVSGAYLRASWRTRQWSAETSIDWLESVSGRSSDGFYSNTGARWRLNRDHSVGAGFSVRRFAGDAWTSYGDWRWNNGLGTTGLRLEFEGGESQAAAQMLTYDQEWPVPQGWALSTSLGVGRSDGLPSIGQPAEDLWSAALSLNAPLTSRANLRANLASENGSTGRRRQSVNLGASWRIDPRWTLEGSYVRTTGTRRTRFNLDPLAPPETLENTSAYRSFFVMLRYEWQAGSRLVPLGGSAADGGGRIAGTVYFDNNRSGTQEASETGVPNVTVFLDNRYAVRTDNQGRFEFPFVATGARTVTVRNETLPLPWSVVDEGQVQVDVRLRDSTALAIPVQRSE
jgi:hypothetical protein